MTEPAPIPPTRAESKKRRVGCLARLLVTAISCVVAVVLAEVAVRLLGDEVLPNPIGPRYLYVNDETMGVAMSPGFRGRFSLYGEFDVPIEINSRGFRDREFGEKEAGVKRIISLGDSFGFGFGVRAEDTYAKVLESRLNRGSDDRRYEVLNAAASGIGILEMIEILKRVGPWFGPDVVVAAFFYGNDLQDIAKFPQHTVRGGIVITPYFGDRVDESAWLQFCFNYSNLALLIERAKFNLTTGANLGTIAKPGEGGWNLRPVMIRPDPDNAEEVEWFREQEALWPRFAAHLATLAQESEKLGAKLVLIAIPQEFQTRDPVWQKMIQSVGSRAGDYDRFLIGKKLTPICEGTGVPFLDLVPGFRATPPEKTRFFRLNKHFNTEGHAFAAQLVEEFLRKRGLL